VGRKNCSIALSASTNEEEAFVRQTVMRKRLTPLALFPLIIQCLHPKVPDIQLSQQADSKGGGFATAGLCLGDQIMPI
jgi:hypothetical protein